MDVVEPTPEALQRKLYFLLEQLQDMARELPPFVFTLLINQIVF